MGQALLIKAAKQTHRYGEVGVKTLWEIRTFQTTSIGENLENYTHTQARHMMRQDLKRP